MIQSSLSGSSQTASNHLTTETAHDLIAFPILKQRALTCTDCYAQSGSLLSRYLNQQTLTAYPSRCRIWRLQVSFASKADGSCGRQARISTAIMVSNAIQLVSRSDLRPAGAAGRRRGPRPRLSLVTWKGRSHFPSKNLKVFICICRPVGLSPADALEDYTRVLSRLR